MKIDRVILTSNFNQTYLGFWNPLSKLYKVKFGITPTLIFLGSEEELEKSNLSSEYGEIIRQDLVPTKNKSWICTWALFYFTKFFKDDVCLIMGIDQIPLGTYFIVDLISDIDSDTYVMLIDDAYKLTTPGIVDWSENGFSPSAYHIAKGEIFNKIYNFELNFDEEIKKIESLNLQTMWGNNWGLDEAYSSKVLYGKKDTEKIIGLKSFSKIMNGGRVECYRTQETPYDLTKLNNNQYIECHACRPYEEHQRYLNQMISDIPNFVEK